MYIYNMTHHGLRAVDTLTGTFGLDNKGLKISI